MFLHGFRVLAPMDRSHDYFTTVMNMPIVKSIPVQDDLGTPYAFDLALTDGFYVTVVSYVLLRLAVRTLSRGA